MTILRSRAILAATLIATVTCLQPAMAQSNDRVAADIKPEAIWKGRKIASVASAPLDETGRLLVDYAVQITRDATQITRAHHDRLRVAGFDDQGILQITLIASWFNYINRVADSLGVGRD